jgi:hypothetical protein
MIAIGSLVSWEEKKDITSARPCIIDDKNVNCLNWVAGVRITLTRGQWDRKDEPRTTRITIQKMVSPGRLDYDRPPFCFSLHPFELKHSPFHNAIGTERIQDIVVSH